MSQLYFTKNLVSWFNIGEDMIVYINTKKANLGTKKLFVLSNSILRESVYQNSSYSTKINYFGKQNQYCETSDMKTSKYGHGSAHNN